MPPNKLTICSSILLSMFAAPIPAQVTAEVEPNDRLAEADHLGIFGPNDEVVAAGRIGGALGEATFDVDLFALEILPQATGPFRLRADLSTSDPNIDLYLRVFNIDGEQLYCNDDRAMNDRDPLIALTVLTPKRLYVGVSGNVNTLYEPLMRDSGIAGKGGGYHLLISLTAEKPPNSPFEPNDDTASATALGRAPATVTGEFIGDGANGELDVDLYRLTLDLPAVVRATVKPSTDSFFDPYVSIASPCPPCQLVGNDDAGPDTRNAHTAMPAFEASDVFIQVVGAPREPRVHGSLGYYDLEVEVQPFDPSGANEPNDSISMATPIGPTGRGLPQTVVVEGHIGDGPYAMTRGDRDFYAYWPPIDEWPNSEPGFVELTLTPTAESPLVPILSAFDADSRPFARTEGTAGEAKLLLPAACVEVEHEPSPAFYFSVTSGEQRPILDPHVPPQGEAPDLTVEAHLGQAGPYRVTAKPVRGQPECAPEPNDAIEQATETGLHDSGVYVCGGLWINQYPDPSGPSDVDVWVLHVEHAPALLQTIVSRCEEEALEIDKIRVLSADGALVQSFSELDFGRAFLPLSLFRVPLDVPGDYFVEISGYYGAYDLALTLTQGPADAPLPTTANATAGEPTPQPHLYASRVDGTAAMIDVLDPLTGGVLTSFESPERPMTGAEALVANAGGLLVGGVGRYPTFYQLTPLTGEIVNSFVAWFGSGQYSDAVMLDDTLFLLDLRQQSIHAVDPAGRFVKRTLSIGNRHGITIGGGMAALAAPNRLYVADAFDTRRIYEIDPRTGALLRTLPETDVRGAALAGLGDGELFVSDWTEPRMDVLGRDGVSIESIELSGNIGALGGAAFAERPGDVNGDGQLDLRDVATLYRCFGSPPDEPTCQAADLNGDGFVDAADTDVMATNLIGP